jgi:hypothetical protein
MATPQALGNLKTASTPRYLNGMIWFQEDATNRLMVMPMDDPPKAFNPGGLTTLSEPVLVVGGRYMTFRGEGDKVMMVAVDAPYLHGQLGSETCLSAPVASGIYLYFQGPGNSLIRSRIDRLEHTVLVKDTCAGRPGVAETRAEWLYYLSTDRWSDEGEDKDQVHTINVKSLKPGTTYIGNSAGLYVAPNLWCWAVTYAKLGYPFEVSDRFGSSQHLMVTAWSPLADPIRPCMAPYGSDKNIYYVYHNDLYRVPARANVSERDKTLMATGCATSPEVQFGFVLYGGTDKKIYKLAL